MNKTCDNFHQKKYRTNEEKKHIITRLKTIEGQVRGIMGMIDDDRYCGEILIQISAINQSLKSLGTEILKNHLLTCVVENIQKNNLDILDEVMDLIKKLD